MYVVECYSPAIDREAVRSSGQRATATGEEMRKQGRLVDYLGALLVPGDEVVFHLFAATSPATVRDASLRAGIEFERVVESIPVGVHAFNVAGRSAEVR
jgi:hypothetical protein